MLPSLHGACAITRFPDDEDEPNNIELRGVASSDVRRTEMVTLSWPGAMICRASVAAGAPYPDDDRRSPRPPTLFSIAPIPHEPPHQISDGARSRGLGATAPCGCVVQGTGPGRGNGF